MDFFIRYGRALLLAAAAVGAFAYTAAAQTAGAFTDARDGKTYKTVRIGGKTWMAQNLNYRTERRSCCYNNDDSYCERYGRLYDWNTANAACPAGWRLPSREEWGELAEAAGGEGAAGGKLKSAGGWNGNGGGTDDVGFSALPGGYRNGADGSFGFAGGAGFWWTAAENDGGNAFYRSAHSGYGYVKEEVYNKGGGFSARCVADAAGRTENDDIKHPVRNVAVVESEVDASSGASSGITPAEVRLVTTELRREAVKNLPSDRYSIMTTETVYAQGSATLEECAEENCVVTLGSKIGADYIVRGIISKLRDRFTLSVEVYETENGNLVASSDPVRSKSIDELVEKSAAACTEMYGKFVAAENSRWKSKTRYAIDAGVNPPNGGAVLRNPDRDEYAVGTKVSLMATPAEGYVFTGWSGAADGTGNPAVVVMDGNKTVMANFAVAAESEPAGGGVYGNKRGNRPNIGGGIYFAPEEGGWADNVQSYGVYLYYEYTGRAVKLLYNQFFSGYFFGGGKLESDFYFNHDEATLSGIFLGNGVKWLFNRGGVRFFPMFEMRIDMTSIHIIENELTRYITDDRDLFWSGSAWLNMGGGLDYDIGNTMYLRVEAMYGIGFSVDELTFYNQYAYYNGYNIYYRDDADAPNSLCHRFTVRAGIGFKL